MEPSENPMKTAEKPESTFYIDGAEYWSNIEPNIDGMLGGLSFLSSSDIQASERFLKTLYKLPDPPGKSRVLDCGSGIGRISDKLLQRHFDKVDLVDQDEKFIETAIKNFEGNEKIGQITCCGLQKFIPEKSSYDVIWVQWVLSHMTDDDLIAFIQRCCDGLKENGVLVIKENCTNGTKMENDDIDSSITRPYEHFMDVFKASCMKVQKSLKQKNFPKDLYPVWMFALVKKRDVPS